jgi:anti-sigma factor RsiW
MNQPIDEARFHALLPGYVDGELETADRVAMAEYIAADPRFALAVADQERLRAAIHRVMTRDVPAMSERLASRAAFAPPRGSFRITPWLAAMAACLILSAGVSIGLHMRPTSRNASINSGEFSPVLISGLTRTHVGCSRLVHHENLHARAEAGPLPTPLQQFENGHSGVPDFTSFGYTFEGADPCPVPGGLTMHLVYRATGGKLEDTISLFVQLDDNQVKIEPDRLYTAVDGTQPHPILIWRTGGMVYYLVGDAMDTVENAEKIVRARGVAMVHFD